MRYLLWAAGIACVMTFISVLAEAAEASDDVAARVAPKPSYRLPASNLEATSGGDEAASMTLPAEYEGSSIEVGFSQDKEPEPHLLAIGSVDRVKLFQLEEAPERLDERRAPAPAEAPAKGEAKLLPVSIYVKRLRHAVENDGFFTARQPRPKRRCKDRYVLRINFGSKFRERRGCTNQSNDPFAALSQLVFRDAFLAMSRGAR